MNSRPRTKSSRKRIARIKAARRLKKKKPNPTIGWK